MSLFGKAKLMWKILEFVMLKEMKHLYLLVSLQRTTYYLKIRFPSKRTGYLLW